MECELMSYFTIPSFVVDNKVLSVAEKYLYGYFHTHYFNGNTIFVSNANLAGMLNCEVRQIQNILNSLETKKYITRDEENIKGKNRRVITPLVTAKGKVINEEKDIHNHHAINCIQKEKKKEKKKEKNVTYVAVFLRKKIKQKKQ